MRYSFSKSGIITLLVGPDKAPLQVHKGLLCAKSKFFKACFEGSFAEADKSSVDLPEDNVSVVEDFISWLYGSALNIDDPHVAPGLPESYRFADRILSESYQNDIMDAIRKDCKVHDRYLDCSEVTHLYKAGLGGSQLASFALKGCVHALMSQTGWDDFGISKQDVEPWYNIPQLIKDFTEESISYRVNPFTDPSLWTGCSFHCHKEGSECSAKAAN